MSQTLLQLLMDTNNKVYDGQRLKEYRHYYYESKGLKVPYQAQAALDILGLKSASNFSMVENGQKPMPQRWKEVISKQLGYDFQEFRYDIEKKVKPTERIEKKEAWRDRIANIIKAIIDQTDFTAYQLGRKLLPHWSNSNEAIEASIECKVSVEDLVLMLFELNFKRTGHYGVWEVNADYVAGRSADMFVLKQSDSDELSISSMKNELADVLTKLDKLDKIKK